MHPANDRSTAPQMIDHTGTYINNEKLQGLRTKMLRAEKQKTKKERFIILERNTESPVFVKYVRHELPVFEFCS